MKVRSIHPFFNLLVMTSAWFFAVRIYGENAPITLQVDAREAPRKILHARLVIPVTAGPLTLCYPKWIPGEHGPTGPITDLAGLKMTVGGKTIPWQRDRVDMYAFHLTLPEDATDLEVALDFLISASPEDFSSGASATAQLVDINWNQLLLYPKGANIHELPFVTELRLPTGWQFGTALSLDRDTGNSLIFLAVSLETLVDSPLIAGAHFRHIDLSPNAQPAHWLHMVADSEAALNILPDEIAHYRRLVSETGALFGARHYHSYNFLLTLSDNVAHFGLEHHESSDDRAPERLFLDPALHDHGADLLPHEMVHSWNGKYRRPADLTTPDFQRPMKTDLLWVYEGLTQYLGELLATRCGLLSPENHRQMLALTAAQMDYQAGRSWRSLADTAIAAQILYARRPWTAWRREVDFYPEGWLIWLEADILIRERTQGQHSLDDFCRLFFGGEGGPPAVVTYNFDDVIGALNEITPYNWRHFFNRRVRAINARAPLGGIEGGGWRLAYQETIPDLLKSAESVERTIDLTYSLGMVLKEDGIISDVIPQLSAAKAGIGPGMKLLGVNGRRWTSALLHDAIKEAKTKAHPLELLIENGDFFTSCSLDYHDGEKYPYLERDDSHEDILAQILKPLSQDK